MCRITSCMFVVLISMLPPVAFGAGAWRGPSNGMSLENDAIKARFQGGLLCALTDKRTGKALLLNDVAKLPAKLPLFGPNHTVDLDSAKIESKKKDPHSVTAHWQFDEGSTWDVEWSIEPKS